MSLMRTLRRLAIVGAAGALVKKVLDSRRSATPAPAAAAPVPAPTDAPEPVRATAPVDAPGPSVTAPAPDQGSETERAEAAERGVPEPAPGDDPLVAEEEAAAAAEAAAIGGPGVDDAHGNPAMEAVYEAGGGEAEGFEAAEDALIENASHGAGRADPLRDAITPEVEADEVTAIDAEADEIIEADDRGEGR
jgi:hypothetical protein